ncbi:MAG TPA: hypothetical protein VMZ52_02825, partial [Bryobacteraceae bacterium]|nr:hypothetical protein [Bryobacteraceae bacterium]
MASAAQIRANRANSARSTGPRTPEGIAACNGNALRHGLTSKQIILKGESADDFEALVADLAASYHPAN